MSGAQIGGGGGRRWLGQAKLTSIRWLQVAHARHTVLGCIRVLILVCGAPNNHDIVLAYELPLDQAWTG